MSCVWRSSQVGVFSGTTKKSKKYRKVTFKSVFKNDKDSVTIGPYQLQSGGLGDSGLFGPVYDCTPLMGEMLWVTVIGFLLFVFLLSVGIYFILSIEIPPRFETPRSKPLIIPDN